MICFCADPKNLRGDSLQECGFIMRRRKKHRRAAPFAVGLLCGYIAELIVAALGALLLSFTDIASGGAGVTALIAAATGSLVCGRTAGIIKRRDGLKTGALCGLLFFLPLLLLSIIFGAAGSMLLPVKALLCLGFATAGGVMGVNKEG